MVVTLSCSLQGDRTPLHFASYYGHLTEVELLLTAGANPDLQNKVKTDSMNSSIVVISFLRPYTCAIALGIQTVINLYYSF